jgi:hypothetical protein
MKVGKDTVKLKSSGTLSGSDSNKKGSVLSR